MNNSKIITIALLFTTFATISSDMFAVLTKDLNLIRNRKKQRRRANPSRPSAQPARPRTRVAAPKKATPAPKAVTSKPAPKRVTRNPRTKGRGRSRGRGRGREIVRPTTKRPAANRRQANDPFVRNLIQNGVVLGHERLPDGSYVIQIKSASQSDRRISGPFGGATCPAMTMRSSQLMVNYFLTGDIEYIKKIQNTDDAVAFLKTMQANQFPFSNLHGGTVETILQGDLLNLLEQYNAQNSIIATVNENNSILIESMDNLTLDYYNIHTDLRDKIELLRTNLEHAGDEFYSVLPFRLGTIHTMNAKSGGHWISVTVTKRNGTPYWFVVNSTAGNHIGTVKQIAQRILNGRTR